MQVRIPWRRRDLVPPAKNVIVIDAATGERVKNVLPVAVTRESGFLLFEPRIVPGDYYVYYMPYKSEGRKNYPNVKYDPPEATEDPAWNETAGQIPLADAPPGRGRGASIGGRVQRLHPDGEDRHGRRDEVPPRQTSRGAVSPVSRRP